jgi:purine-nucleoside phosphorylase
MNELIAKTAGKLRKSLPKCTPRLAIVLGSGFNALARQIEVLCEIRYEALPGFPVPSVPGHAGKLLLGKIGECNLLLLCGRSHFYEGHSMAQITFPIRVLAAIGVQTLVLTNAAGGINPRFRPDDLMCITDHINFMGANPLRDERTLQRPAFVDLSEVYDPALIRLFGAAARSANIRLHRGVYIAVSGPSYETPAEIRAFARLGADAVGMSTVPEAIVARHCGMRVTALSCFTNLAAGKSETPIDHGEVLASGERVQRCIANLLVGFVERFSRKHRAGEPFLPDTARGRTVSKKKMEPRLDELETS